MIVFFFVEEECDKDQRNIKLRDPIAQEKNLGPKEFTLRFMSKVWKNEVMLMWYHKPTISRLKKSSPPSLKYQT